MGVRSDCTERARGIESVGWCCEPVAVRRFGLDPLLLPAAPLQFRRAGI
jgi:hypothetical protein